MEGWFCSEIFIVIDITIGLLLMLHLQLHSLFLTLCAYAAKVDRAEFLVK